MMMSNDDEHFVEPLCGTSLWNLFVEPLCGTSLWNLFVEPLCGTSGGANGADELITSEL